MVEKDLGRLPPVKTEAEYEPEGIPAPAATKAAGRARRCVAVARRTAPRRASRASVIDRSPPRFPSRDGEI